jgi:hypothetical protein
VALVKTGQHHQAAETVLEDEDLLLSVGVTAAPYRIPIAEINRCEIF